jgi:hypothetical protein
MTAFVAIKDARAVGFLEASKKTEADSSAALRNDNQRSKNRNKGRNKNNCNYNRDGSNKRSSCSGRTLLY